MSITRSDASNKLSLYLAENPDLRLMTLCEDAKASLTETMISKHGIDSTDDEMLAYLYVAITKCPDWDQNITNKIRLYHGTADPDFKPNPNYKNEHTDYGSGLYLTPYLNLAKEWSTAFVDCTESYVFQYDLDLKDLIIFDFDQVNPLVWLAELAYHYKNDEGTLEKLRKNIDVLIDKYRMFNVSRADVITGWRADSTFGEIYELAIENRFTMPMINEALKLGDLKAQYCIKSDKAYKALQETVLPTIVVQDVDTWKTNYKNRMKSVKNDIFNITGMRDLTGPILEDYLED